MTHPFHPWRGRRFELFHVRQNWGEWRVMYYDDGQRLQSLPRAWTSLAPADPFEVTAAGRALFRTDTLLRLVTLLRDLNEAAGKEEGRCEER